MIKLSPQEKHLILELRNLMNGEIVLKIQNFKLVAAYTKRQWDKEDIERSGSILNNSDKKVDSQVKK